MSAAESVEWGYPDLPPDVIVVEPSPIFPGDSLVIEWHWPHPNWIQEARVEVRLEDHVLTRRSASADGSTITLGPPGNAHAAQLLYQIGPKNLTVRVVDKNLAIGASGFCRVLVERPPVEDWWIWKWPGRDLVSWNRDYNVGGELANHGRARLRGLQAWFRQISPEGEDLPFKITLSDLYVAQGHPLRVERHGICHDWRWFKAWDPIYEKRFRYALDLEIADEYGNEYLIREVPENLVSVKVSADKRKYGYLDPVLRGVAVGLTFGGSLLVERAVDLAKKAWGARGERHPSGAFGAGKMAEDPPQPDFDFKERVSIEGINVRYDGDWGALTPIAEALGAINTIIAAADALSAIENKWLGARELEDVEGARLQRSDYLVTLSIVARTASRMGDLAAAVRRTNILTRQQFGEQLYEWHNKGLPPEILAEWRRQEVPLELAQLAASTVASRGAGSLSEDGIGPLLATGTEIAKQIADDLVRINPETSFEGDTKS